MSKPVITTATPTGSTTATVSGTSDAGAAISVLQNGTQRGTATANGSGAWTANLTGMTAGTSSLTAIATITKSSRTNPLEVCMARLTCVSPSGSTSTDTTPQVTGNLFLYESGNVEGLVVQVYYRLAGDTTWIFDGDTVTDASGDYVYDLVTLLADDEWEFKAEALGVTVTSAAVSITINKPNEAPILPPDAPWTVGTANHKYGYLGNMFVGVGVTNGWVLGSIPVLNLPKPAPAWSMTGDTSGLTINSSTGEISVSNTSLITTAGTRNVTITATNSQGADSVTLPITVVTTATGWKFFADVAAGGSEANAGLLPHEPKTVVTDSIFGNVLFKRGSTFSAVMYTKSNSNYMAYGDPSAAQPEFDTTATNACEVSASPSGQKVNVNIRDIAFAGNSRCIFLSNCDNVIMERVTCAGNKVNSNNSQGMYLHNQTDLGLYSCETVTVFGDGIYLSKTLRAEVAYCVLGVPEGGGADCMQVTFSGDTQNLCEDIWIHHCTMQQSPTSTSLKGSLVVEGVTRYLVEYNELQGRYFGFSNQGNFGTTRQNYAHGARITNNIECWGIGCGGSRNVAHDQIIYDNLVEDCYNGMLISGFSDADGNQRYDFEQSWNVISGCTFLNKHARAASGYFVNTLGFDNTNNTYRRSGAGLNVATGGDYTTYTFSPNFLQTVEGPVNTVAPAITGTVADGQTVSVSTGTWSGSPTSYAYQWRLNGRDISGATSSSYAIPALTSASLNTHLPTSKQVAELSCVVIATDVAARVGLAVGSQAGTQYITVAA